MTSSEASTRRRVKLYMLNDERQWDDKGTGHVSAIYTEQDNMALVVISETDGSYLLESKIQPDTAYQKQQETLIVWSEGENMDLALSFQEKVGCDDVWEKICAVQGKDPSVEITQEVVDESDDVDDADGYTPSLIQSIQPLALPPCELSHLEETAFMISQAVASPQKRDRLVVLLESTNYLNQLMDLFHKAEDLEDMESLHHLYEIMRQVILINKHSLYETLFADDMLMEVIGILEYNPSGRTKHREFLRSKVTFKEVLPLYNADLKSKIHQTYRVQYIQDCCLPPPCLFDEQTLSQLKNFVSLNKMEIIRALQDDEEFMRRLFARLKSVDTDVAHRRELSLFIKEFCNISMQTDQKESFLNCLFQHGALKTAEVLLATDDRDMKSAALEILQAFVEHQPSVVREYVYKETAPFRKDDELLINLMIIQLLSDSDPELSDAFLLGYMLRILIDPDNMNNPGARGEKSEFLNFFYRRCINTLVRPLFDNTVKDILEKDDYHTALVLNHILELLTFCIETHTYHMKNYCLHRDLLKRVLVLLQSSHKFLVLTALRLLRRVIHMKEEFYNRYLIKNNLFRPVLKLFVANEHRYNLVDSAIIELFDHIRTEEITSLITHVVENFWDILKTVTYVPTFIDFKRTYDHTHRPSRPMVGTVGQPGSMDVLSLVNVASSRFQRDPRSLEREEERWFDQDEEEDDEEDEGHLFTHQSAALLNGALNGVGTSTLPTAIPEALSTVPVFEAHTSPATVGSDLLGLSSTEIHPSVNSLTPLSTGPAHASPSDSRSAFTSSSGPSLVKTTNSTSDTPSVLNPTFPRARQIDTNPDPLPTRSHLPRQNTPIAIQIKLSLPDSDSGGTFANDEVDQSTSDSHSRVTASCEAVVSQSELSEGSADNGASTSGPSDLSEEDTADGDVSSDHRSVLGKRATSDVHRAESGKFSKKSRQSPKSHSSLTSVSSLFSDDQGDENCAVSPDPGISPCVSEADEDLGDQDRIGLVDYSDEESEDDERTEIGSCKDFPGTESKSMLPTASKVPDENLVDGGCEVSSSQSVAEIV
ncbi:Serine/threonine-protein phosphatase 4 regulatory subunit 3 [Fasciola gigantica]|uniref:Serine/threonine-protein phosphatase 4 regulatory subunit 3 n=1 Tax=Fasciola gigantica TaxID=46835 RepID=A0A504YS50_FASGI|nr:Serine/threonine-protein phosphatase 4 regulatory subunit 3 [Fasciola gigantica]